MRSLRAAFVFFTRIPVGGFPYTALEFQRANAFFPLVGAFLGLLLSCGYALLLPLGAFPAAVLVLGVSMLLTGAFHEDGLADSSDALGGGFDRERVLEILKDSRVGTYGSAALVVSLVGRAALIGEMDSAAILAFPWVGAVSRLAPIWLMTLMPYATDRERAKSREIVKAQWPQGVAATAWVVGVCLIYFYFDFEMGRVWVMALALILVALLCGWRYHKRVQGITGDFLGATQQLSELVAWGVLCWQIKNG